MRIPKIRYRAIVFNGSLAIEFGPPRSSKARARKLDQTAFLRKYSDAPWLRMIIADSLTAPHYF